MQNQNQVVLTLVIVDEKEDGSLFTPYFEKAHLYGLQHEDASVSFFWVRPSGNVQIPENGIALKPAWRFADEEDDSNLKMPRTVVYYPNS